MMEQAGCAAGDQASGPGAGVGATRHQLARRLRAWFAATHSGGFGNPSWGHYDPCARSSLTARFITGHASAGRSWANAERHSLEPQQSVERRAGLRDWPVISGDPEIDLAARQVTGCGVSAPAPVGALLPSFFRGVETDKGIRHPGQTGGGALA